MSRVVLAHGAWSDSARLECGRRPATLGRPPGSPLRICSPTRRQHPAPQASLNGPGRCEADPLSDPEDAGQWQAEDVISRGYKHDPAFMALLAAGKTVTGSTNVEGDFADRWVQDSGALAPGTHVSPWRIEDELTKLGANYVQAGRGRASPSGTATW
jgi:hypothetical protein